MKKRITKRNFIALAIVAVLGLIFTIFSFNIPFTTNTFKGFARAINTGLDFGDGTRAVFTVERADYSKFTSTGYLDSTVTALQKQAVDKYTDAKVYALDDNKICIEVPDTYIPSDLQFGVLEMKKEKKAEADTYLNGSHIKSVKYQMNGAQHGVFIQFTEEGSKLFEKLTSDAIGSNSSSSSSDSSSKTGTIYICLNKDYDNAQGITISEKISQGYAYITMSNKSSAKLYAKMLENSKYGVNFTQEGDTVKIYSNFNTFAKVVCAVVMCLVIILSFVYLILKFKDMGWVASLAMLFNALFNIITFSLISSFRLTLGSCLGMILGYLITFFAVVVLLEKYKAEFESGKKLNPSFKSGYKKALPVILDLFAVSVFVNALVAIFMSGFAFSFAIAMLINNAFGAITSLLIMLWFSRMYLKINKVKGERLNFFKGDNVDEIKTK